MLKTVLISTLLLAGCNVEAERSVASTNNRFQPEQLFSTEGCTVFRFHDGRRAHYFAKCKAGATTSSTYSCGKNCTNHEMIHTE